MSKHCSENERMKREYVLYFEAASGHQRSTADAALRLLSASKFPQGEDRSRSFTSNRRALASGRT
jgi:hypothetical protein